MADAVDDMLLDRSLKDFWWSDDPNVCAVLEKLLRLRHEARYGDPLVVGGQFGKGRVVAFMTSTGRQWNDFAGGSVASMVYVPFLWETANYLTRQEREHQAPRKPKVHDERPPQLIGVDLAYTPTRFASSKKQQPLGPVHLVTPDASIPFVGTLYSDTGLRSAHWLIEVHRIDLASAKKDGKEPAAPLKLKIPLAVFGDQQDRRALNELTRKILAGDRPAGLSRTHFLDEERAFDFRTHLGHLKTKKDELPPHYLVRMTIAVTGNNAKADSTHSKPFVFLVVSEMELLLQSSNASMALSESLGDAQEKVRNAQILLNDQIAKLQAPDVELDGVTVRVSEVRAKLQGAGHVVREIDQAFARMLAELAVNRVKKKDIDAVNRIAAPLARMVHDRDAGFHRADDSVDRLSVALEERQKEMMLPRPHGR